MKLISQGSVLDLSYPHVMGILNITPDSFFDGGVHRTLTELIDHTNLMIQAGATIIDIGGESTRPGAVEISVEEELSRVIPVIEVIMKRFKIWVSVNTSKAEVMYESSRMGVHIINDVRSLSEPNALKTAAKIDLPVCLMHMQGKPKTMQNNPRYNDVLSEINSFFIQQIAICEQSGIKKEKLLLDPGFGFGKSLFHNYEILAHLSDFRHFNLPILVGMSRKSMIGKLLNVSPYESLSGSLACAVIAVMQGANIIRVHDVKDTVEAIRVTKTILSAKGKYYE